MLSADDSSNPSRWSALPPCALIDIRAQSERRILEALEQCRNIATRREMRQRINRQTMSSDEFFKSLEVLCNDGTLELQQEGRKTLYVRVPVDYS